MKVETGSKKFPEVDRDEYFARNASEAAANHNDQLKKGNESPLEGSWLFLTS